MDKSRFAAKLLFQFRVVIDGDSGKRRICEERIVVFQSRSYKEALVAAKRKGNAVQFRYTNDEGNPVHFEFVGVLDLLELGMECDEEEVWYDIVERLQPMERKRKLIPSDSYLTR